ncbi:MAG TPA: ribonuclease P protein subunit [Candidatus Korarchaeota archaeon]|nr:ribonuclease P protein subunit [Candidatus Korarchaeota archaeon]
MKRSDLPYHELIGLKTKVVFSPDPTQIGIYGEIIDETANLLIIKTKKGIKKIPKEHRIFKFVIDDRKVIEVMGKDILGRPEERVKKL